MKTLILLIGLVLIQDVFAQRFTARKRYISADISYQTSYFSGGDIRVHQNETLNSGFGINVQRKYRPRLSLGVNYTFSRLRAKDYLEVQHADHPCTGLQLFELGTNVHAVGANTMVDLLANYGTFLKRSDYNFYLYLGSEAAYVHHRLPRSSEARVALPSGGFTALFPTGVGVRLRRGKMGDVSLEFLHYLSSSPRIDLDLKRFDYAERNDRWFAFRIRIS